MEMRLCQSGSELCRQTRKVSTSTDGAIILACREPAWEQEEHRRLDTGCSSRRSLMLLHSQQTNANPERFQALGWPYTGQVLLISCTLHWWGAGWRFGKMGNRAVLKDICPCLGVLPSVRLGSSSLISLCSDQEQHGLLNPTCVTTEYSSGSG